VRSLLHRLLGSLWLCSTEEATPSRGKRERTDQSYRTIEQHLAAANVAFGQTGVVLLEESGEPPWGAAIFPASLQPVFHYLTITLHLYPLIFSRTARSGNFLE